MVNVLNRYDRESLGKGPIWNYYNNWQKISQGSSLCIKESMKMCIRGYMYQAAVQKQNLQFLANYGMWNSSVYYQKLD